MWLHALSLFALANFLAYSDAEAKRTVCSITINSEDEIERFKAGLKPKNAFEFVELTRFETAGDSQNFSKESWFENACKSGVKCDLLIVSGHFGGSFFGKSGKTLTVEQLEEARCLKSCAGILQHPKEVYLFGCNTLAGRGRQSRTREQHDQALRGHEEISAIDRARMVEAMFGAWGQSYQDRMRRVFSGVPHIYGFYAVGPYGHQVRHMIDGYLGEIRDYQKYLDKIGGQQICADLQNVQRAVTEKSSGAVQLACPGLAIPKDLSEKPRAPARNKTLARHFKVTNFAETTGLNQIPTAKESAACELNSRDVRIVRKLQIIEQFLAGEDRLAYIPQIENFFRNHPPEKYADAERAALSRISENPVFRRETLAYVKSLQSPMLKFDTTVLAKHLGWLSEEEFRKESVKILEQLVSSISGNMHHSERDLICSIAVKYGDTLGDLNFDAILVKNRGKWDANLAHAMSCIGAKNRGVMLKLADDAKDIGIENTVIIDTIGHAMAARSFPEVTGKLLQIGALGQEKYLAYAVRMLGYSKTQGTRAIDLMESAMQEKHSLSTRLQGLWALKGQYSIQPKQAQRIVEILKRTLNQTKNPEFKKYIEMVLKEIETK